MYFLILVCHSIAVRKQFGLKIMNTFLVRLKITPRSFLAQSTGAAEYTDYISAEEYDSFNECPHYNTKQSEGEAPVMLKLWGMQSTPSLPSFLGPLWLRVIALYRVLSMGQIELNNVLN